MAMTSLCANLANGPCNGVPLNGTFQVVIGGTFVSTAYPDGVSRRCRVFLEVSADGGTTWVSPPGASTDAPTTLVLILGTGAQLRANVSGGATGVAIDVDYGAP
jgi:hypothetical protein